MKIKEAVLMTLIPGLIWCTIVISGFYLMTIQDNTFLFVLCIFWVLLYVFFIHESVKSFMLRYMPKEYQDRVKKEKRNEYKNE